MKLNLKFVFITFTLLNLVSGFLRVLSHYDSFITKEIDIVLYLIQIIILMFIYRIACLITPKRINASKVRHTMRNYIICESALLYIICMCGNVTSKLTGVMIIFLFILKQVLEFLLYYCALWDISDYSTRNDYLHERQLATRKIKILILSELSIVLLFFFLMHYKTSKLLIAVYVLILVRTYIEFKISKYISESFDGKCEGNPSIRKIVDIKLAKSEIIKIIIVFGLVGLTLILRFTYIDHDVEMEYDDRGFEYHYLKYVDNSQYFNNNLMPSWTGFCDRRYGVHNLIAGTDTGAIYKDELYFDKNGIAWDHDRHLIDIYGNELIETPAVMNLQKSYGQKTLDEFIDMCCENDIYQIGTDSVHGGFKGIGSDYRSYEYFYNGLGCYYCDFFNRYGLISQNGEVVTPPKYRYMRIYEYYPAECMVALVEDENGDSNVLNKEGIELVGEEYGKDRSVYLCNLGIIHIRSCVLNCSDYYINTKGELLSPDYYYDGGELCGDILCVKKYEDDNNTYIFGADGKLLFYSDEYSSYEAHANSNGEVTCMLVYSKEKCKYGLIDFDGNLVTKDWYPLIEFRDGSYNCYSYANDRTLLETVELE